MATRRAATKKSSSSTAAADVPPHITDHFKPTRTRGGPRKALFVDEPITEPAAVSEAPTRSRSRGRKLFASANEAGVKVEPSGPLAPIFIKKEPKSEPSPPPCDESTVQEKAKEITKAPEPVRSMIPVEGAGVTKKTPPKKKLTSVAALQAALVAKGAAKAIHDQAIAHKLTQVADREAHLKSPRKQVVTKITSAIGASPPKRARASSKGRKGPVKVHLPPPDFVLPNHKQVLATPEKEEEEAEEDSIARAPTTYGSTLLLPAVKKSTAIPLPNHYADLHALFTTCDRIISLLLTQGRTVTLSQLQNDVSKQARMSFTRARFAQLLSVFPDAYRVKLQRLTRVGSGHLGATVTTWEHVIKPNVDDDLNAHLSEPLPKQQYTAPTHVTPSKLISPMKGRSIISSTGLRIPASPRKGGPMPSPVKVVVGAKYGSCSMDSAPLIPQADTRVRLEGWRLSCRGQIFRYLLTERVVAEHERFLRGIEGADALPTPSLRLHQKFAAHLSTECPRIPEAPMEEEPEEERELKKQIGMGDFLREADNIVSMPKAIERGVENALAAFKSPEKPVLSATGVALSPAKFAATKKPMSLLERIRAKENEKKLSEMRRDPEAERKAADIDTWLNRHLLALFDIFRLSQKRSLSLESLAAQLSSGCSGRLPKSSFLPLLTRLKDLVPSHFSIAPTSMGDFFRIIDISAKATEEVEKTLREELSNARNATAAAAARVPGLIKGP